MDKKDPETSLLIESLTHVRKQAEEISEELRVSNERNAVNERVLQGQRKTLKLLIVFTIVVLFLAFAQFVSSIDTRKTSNLLKDCLTPQGDCAQTLGKRNTIAQQIFLKRIEDDRLSTQIEASEASAAAGSLTGAATAEVYRNRREAIAVEITELTKQLNNLDPIKGE